MSWETAALEGGPADGRRVRVANRPVVLQVTFPCKAEDDSDGLQVRASHIYRREQGDQLRYAYDPASP